MLQSIAGTDGCSQQINCTENELGHQESKDEARSIAGIGPGQQKTITETYGKPPRPQQNQCQRETIDGESGQADQQQGQRVGQQSRQEVCFGVLQEHAYLNFF